MQTLFSAYIVEPRSSAQRALKEALSLPENWLRYGFQSIETFYSFQELSSKLRDEPHCDVILLSERLGRDGISSFINTANDITEDQQIGFVLVVPQEEAPNNEIGEPLKSRLDCIIPESCTPEAVQQIIDLAERSRKNNINLKLTAAADLILPMVFEGINQKASKFLEGVPTTPFPKRVCNLLNAFNQLPEDTREQYYELLAMHCANASPRKKNGQNS